MFFSCVVLPSQNRPKPTSRNTLQEFLDDGNGNLKGIKMVNVRWEKIDGQMRLLDQEKHTVYIDIFIV